jgi:dTMP kinase
MQENTRIPRVFLYTEHMMTQNTEPHGLLIMFDGPDGVGKTTQIALAANRLEQQGHKTWSTRTHGGTPMGELLREVSFRDISRVALTDHYISMAIHAELRNEIAEHRARNEIVLVDRSPLSNWAYQVAGSNLREPYVLDDIRRSMQQFAADLVICYHAPLSTLRAHTRSRSNNPAEDYFESKPDTFYEKVIAGYDEAVKELGGVVLNANRDIELVHENTMTLIDKALTLSH